MTDLIQLPPIDRMERVINYAFGGIHHIQGLKKIKTTWFEWWTFTVCGPLSTEDFDSLTRLVIASLEYGVRVEVDPGGPRRLKVRLFPRSKREGAFHERIRFTVHHLTQFDPVGKLNRAAKESKP